MDNNLISHLEKHLGLIVEGWSRDENGKDIPFQVSRFPKGPVEGTITFSTIGLSKTPLKSRVSEKIIKQELIITIREAIGNRNIPAILQQIGMDVLNSGKALLRGDVIGPIGSIMDKSLMEAFYVAMPVYFPDSFSTYITEEGNSVVIAWLAPISYKEALYVRDKGWEYFEDMLMKNDPDLMDIFRQSML